MSGVLQSFLTDGDAARALPVSRGFTIALLRRFTFHSHVFRPPSTPHLHSCLALYSKFDLRITRLSLPKDFNSALLEEGTGRPLLPASLIALAMGAGDPSRSADSMFNDLSNLLSTGEMRQHPAEAKGEYYALARRVDAGSSWRLRPYREVYSTFRGAIPPGALPLGLRFLQLNDWHEPQLMEGSIPPTVTFIQLGRHFTQPLSLLPPSLTHLLLKPPISRPIAAGEWPTSLRWLYLGQGFQQPLEAGSLPQQLLGLDMGQALIHVPIVPGLIPNSVTHLRLTQTFDQPLQGLLPDGLQHLHLGYNHKQPITPHLLPSSLVELVLSHCYQLPLVPGSLPDGLQLLQLPEDSWEHPLQPGVIPPSVVLVLFPKRYATQLVVGAIPPSVRFVRLPRSYWDKVEGLIPHSTHVEWFNQEEREED